MRAGYLGWLLAEAETGKNKPGSAPEAVGAQCYWLRSALVMPGHVCEHGWEALSTSASRPSRGRPKKSHEHCEDEKSGRPRYSLSEGR
jgi:hypothetical protein